MRRVRRREKEGRRKGGKEKRTIETGKEDDERLLPKYKLIFA